MAKTKLKRMDRFELLELIYDMRKANEELTQRCEKAEKKIEELKIEAEERVEAVRKEYVQRIDDLRMQGSAKELQKRMNMIEEQLLAFQQMTGKQTAGEAVNQSEIAAQTFPEAFDAPKEEAAVAAAAVPEPPSAQLPEENVADPAAENEPARKDEE